ncbi:UNVERIFIED_CONTAM: Tyrosine-protein phosphatase non-receptor type 14 [Gekko kuhli]
MPFGLKLRRTRRYNVRSKNCFMTRIRLLDNNEIECTLSVESTGQECLEAVAQRLELREGRGSSAAIGVAVTARPSAAVASSGGRASAIPATVASRACASGGATTATPPQTHYFGLWFHSKSQQVRWVELEKPLKKQMDKFASEPLLFFGVMFYVPSVARLQQEVTRPNPLYVIALFAQVTAQIPKRVSSRIHCI